MRKWLLAAICLGAALLSGCGTEPPSASADVFAMDTYMTITTYGDRCEDALEAAVTEIERLDALLSVGNADSEISRINAGGSGTLSTDARILVEQALDIWRTTGGAFDITVYPIMQAWGFTTGDCKVPSKTELQALLRAAGSERLTLDGSDLTLGAGQGIDLGGIAKGYTSDRLMEIFKAYGLNAGVVSLGGNVQCSGTKPDGSLWRCGIRDPNAPDDPNALLGVVSMIVTKAVNMANLMNIPVLGLVENYSFYRCPDCGGEHPIFGESHIDALAANLGVPVLARLPIDPAIARAMDEGAIETYSPNPLEDTAAALCRE